MYDSSYQRFIFILYVHNERSYLLIGIRVSILFSNVSVFLVGMLHEFQVKTLRCLYPGLITVKFSVIFTTTNKRILHSLTHDNECFIPPVISI